MKIFPKVLNGYLDDETFVVLNSRCNEIRAALNQRFVHANFLKYLQQVPSTATNSLASSEGDDFTVVANPFDSDGNILSIFGTLPDRPEIKNMKNMSSVNADYFNSLCGIFYEFCSL